ncbi:hypothetical protein GCM10009646_57590 [Streptomyces aureus]
MQVVYLPSGNDGRRAGAGSFTARREAACNAHTRGWREQRRAGLRTPAGGPWDSAQSPDVRACDEVSVRWCSGNVTGMGLHNHGFPYAP